MFGEVYGFEAERIRLRLRWRALEAERARLADMPVGQVDPTERQRQIDAEMDAIEFEIAGIPEPE